MKLRLVTILVLFICSSMLTGCRDTTIIENLTLTLVIGMDLNEKNELIVSQSSPVFNKEAVDKEEEQEVKTKTSRAGRNKFDMASDGLSSGGKAQVVLVGKRLLQNPNWNVLLDSFYRDAKNTITSRLVMVDGDVSGVIRAVPKDKPRLPIFLSKMIDSANLRNETVKTTLQDFHRQLKEKGTTATLTVVKLDDTDGTNVRVTGTGLLDSKGRYVTTVGPNETKMIYMLQKRLSGKFPFTILLPELEKTNKVVDTRYISIEAQNIKVKHKVTYADGKFHIDVSLKMGATIPEMFFPYNTSVLDGDSPLERQIEREISNMFTKFIKKTQELHIDPVGFGLYARAYTYSEWKKVQDNWVDAFSRAEVTVSTDIKIQSAGIVK
ncbi:Ger(x)C family spore germination protein [Paenibacillus sp. N1-5-1-14]|uniref:Ger(x)C family spore germination protein n=1 Tax=Paenibacillus radicibacter TaxID=2972488 RepID=UPI002158E516|nr:Ger(x)C family spore germination protein [Paenibacillus radicibacter]MCR8644695.1 Ger(x)C family spore germination protein [Paenibacillus radicibacter]